MNIDFEHLAASPRFAEFTTLLMRLTGLIMALNSPEGNTRWTYGSKGGNPFCRLIRGNSEGLRRCTNCDRGHYEKAVKNNKPQLYTCHAGFLDMAVPIFIQGRHIATISSGQILPEAPGETGFKRILTRISWIDCPEDVLRHAYFKSPYMPREKIKYVMKLLEVFAWQLCDNLQQIKDLEAQLERNEFRRAKEFINEHFHDPSLGLSDIAAHAGLSAAHFSHIFKQSSGIPLVQFIQSRRIIEAKKLMADNNRSITEICFACGFNSLTNFNRVFRHIEHQSPSLFRKKLLKTKN